MAEQSDSHVEAEIQRRIARARAEAERKRQERAELDQARAAGVARRHAQKLYRQAHSTEGTPMAASPLFRTVHCPGCRAQRAARRVGTVTISRASYDVVACPQSGCGLLWCVRPEQPRTAPAAA